MGDSDPPSQFSQPEIPEFVVDDVRVWHTPNGISVRLTSQLGPELTADGVRVAEEKCLDLRIRPEHLRQIVARLSKGQQDFEDADPGVSPGHYAAEKLFPRQVAARKVTPTS